MRVAVLVSGRVDSAQGRKGLIRNNTRLKEKFPGADFCYGTWNSYEREFKETFPHDTCEYFEEPVIQYHPYEINKKYHVNEEYSLFIKSKWAKTNRDKIAHSTKQILIHAWLLDRIKKKYDVIVRTRFDAFIHRSADFTSYIADTFKENRANGFSSFDYLANIIQEDKNKYPIVRDHLLIHPPSFITKKQVDRLNEEKILHPAEYGWAQVLSYPYKLNHRSFLGWVRHDKKISNLFLKEEDR